MTSRSKPNSSIWDTGCETDLLSGSSVPGRCRQDSVLLHRVKCRICFAQKLLNRISVLGIDGDTHADGKLWSIGVAGHGLADTAGHPMGFSFVCFPPDKPK